MAERLTQQEAAYLYGERQGAPMHGGTMIVLQGQISYERYLDLIDTTMSRGHHFRQRPMPVPLNLAHPTWEDDPDFDIRNHVKHATLPAPGTHEQFLAFVAELFAPPLDRSKPLWEMYVINGLEGDRSAIFTKGHHVIITGVSLGIIMSPSPEPVPLPQVEPWVPVATPSPTQRLLDGVWFTLGEQVTMLRRLARGVRNARSVFNEARTIARTFTKSSPWLLRPAPRSPFTRKLSPGRLFARSELSFPELREIRVALGGTVNDVILAVLTGALRRYLQVHAYDVNGPELRAVIPVNPRLLQKGGAFDNRRSGMVTPIPVGEAGPVERLRIVSERIGRLKEENQAQVLDTVTRLTRFAPAPFHMLVSALPVRNRAFNLICTNVPSAPVPVYCLGHLMVEHYPLVPLSPDVGLGAGVFTYCDKLFFALTAESNAVPDIDLLRRFVDESFAELYDAARSAAPSTNGSAPVSDGRGTAAAELPHQQPLERQPR